MAMFAVAFGAINNRCHPIRYDTIR